MEQAQGQPIARFVLTPSIPLDKDFLREVQRIAVNDPMALPVWAMNFSWRPEEEAVYFQEKEWRSLDVTPAPHRVDLYTIQRGLLKIFDVKYDVSIATRQMVLRALFEQQNKPSILSLHPLSMSQVVQLALFDQVIW